VLNRGDAPMTVELRSPCGCAILSPAAPLVEQGGSAPVDVEFIANLSEGRHEKVVSILTNDPDHPRLEFRIRVQLLDRYAVEPVVIDLGEITIGALAQGACTISTKDGSPLRASTVEGPDDRLTGTIEKVEGRDDAVRVMVELRPGRTGPFLKNATLICDHPRQPRALVAVSASVMPRYRVEPPDHLNFGEIERGKGAVQEIKVYAVEGATVEVVSVEIDSPVLRRPAAADPDDIPLLRSSVAAIREGAEYRVRVEALPGIKGGILFGRVDLWTTDPDRPLTTLTLYGKLVDR